MGIIDRGRGSIVPVIKKIKKGSLAHRIGLEPGDELLTVSEQPLRDYIDYLYLTGDAEFTVKVRKQRTGKTEIININSGWQEIGVTLEGIIFDRLKRCNNQCIFCFIDQGLPHARPSLNIKDDDYRFSFLQGSFVTLTNLNEEDWQRLTKLRLGPLYISVHTMDPRLRARMMGNQEAEAISEHLSRLKDAGIDVHIQIVLCPGFNDGVDLNKTLRYLLALGKNVLSIGIVPVGLTKYRQGLPLLVPVDNRIAKETLATVDRWQGEFLVKNGRRTVYAADEFYWLSGQQLPNTEAYEGFPQIENGIGMARYFYDESKKAIKNLKFTDNTLEVRVVTGLMGEWLWQPFLQLIKKKSGLPIELLTVANNDLGGKISVAGLLTGNDIINGLKAVGVKPHTLVFLPQRVFNDVGETLDGLTLQDIKDSFPLMGIYAADNPYAMFKRIKKEIDYA